jgi:hypothetical protein
MNRTPVPDDPPLAAALRACAEGFYPVEAAVKLLICHASWLCRDDFRDGYLDIGTSITDGITTMAVIAALGNVRDAPRRGTAARKDLNAQETRPAALDTSRHNRETTRRNGCRRHALRRPRGQVVPGRKPGLR